MKILFGEDKDFEGTLIRKENLRTGWLHQECLLPKKVTVYETVINAINCTETRAFQILDHYRLKNVEKIKVESISGGQQKKLELAIILEHNPEIIFLDEPTNHLDIFVQEDLEDFLLEANKNVAIVFVSHDEYFSEKMKPEKIIEL
jgi:ATPase subunit of ABC transporter with duplicated ATPase domains